MQAAVSFEVFSQPFPNTELQEQHITDTETMDTSDMDQNQSNREVEERNNN